MGWMFIGNSIVNRRGGGSLSSYWTQQFTEAAGITDETQIAAIKEFISDLFVLNGTENNLINFTDLSVSKIKAIYLFLGSTAETQKYNLLNPVDTDEAFRLTFTGAGHQTNYFESGTNNAANMHIKPSELDVDCQIIMYMIDGLGIAGSRKPSRCCDLTTKNASNVTYLNINIAADNLLTNDSILKPNCFSAKKDNGVVKLHVNGFLINGKSIADITPPDMDMYLGALNNNGSLVYRAGKIAMVIVSNSISDSVEYSLNTAIHKFNVAVGRGIDVIDTLAEGTAYITTRMASVITSSTKTITEAGDYNGKTFVSASINHVKCYPRDYYYIALGGFVTDANILDIYNWIKSHVATTGDDAYWVADSIGADGTEYYQRTDINALDGPPFLALLALLYYENTGNDAWITGEMDFLEALLINSDYQDNLIYTDSSDPKVSWGFYDEVYMDGKLAFANILYYDALKRLADICVDLELTGYDFATYANNIKAAWTTTFWDGTKVKAATGACAEQFDIPAACYALSSGIVEGTIATAIRNAIIANTSDIIKYGLVKYVPTAYYHNETQIWEDYDLRVWSTIGNYQNGGYWFVPLQYLIPALKNTNPTLVNEILLDACNYFRADNEVAESSGVYNQKRVIDYGASGAILKYAIGLV